MSQQTTIEKINSYRSLPKGWHYGEGQAISNEVIECALSIQKGLKEQGLGFTDAFPGLNGEVRVTAYKDDFYLEFTVEEPDEIQFCLESNNIEKECTVYTFAELQNVIRGIKDILCVYDLDFCDKCFQMTNHLNGVCQKCKPKEEKREWNDGIKATDNVTGQEFYFYTEIQNDVENAMLLMGYGSRDYNLSFFKNREQPMDRDDA